MVVTKLSSVDRYYDVDCKGIVLGEAIPGATAIRDALPSSADTLAGRSKAYEQDLNKAHVTALSETESRAQALGVTAFVGVILDYEVIKNMLTVSASGAAVQLG